MFRQKHSSLTHWTGRLNTCYFNGDKRRIGTQWNRRGLIYSSAETTSLTGNSAARLIGGGRGQMRQYGVNHPMFYYRGQIKLQFCASYSWKVSFWAKVRNRSGLMGESLQYPMDVPIEEIHDCQDSKELSRERLETC
jgi:hypothetical protein